MSSKAKFVIERNETDLFLTLDGIVIAKRGQPNSQHAGSWIALEPGYEVKDSPDGKSVFVHRYGVSIN